MRGKITKRSVDALALDAGQAEVTLWDDEVAGFGIRLRASGVKSYFVQYRMLGGRSAALRKVTIGRHGSPWAPDMARIEAKRLLAEVARGIDPGLVRDVARAALTMRELCDLYLAEGVGHKKPLTLAADRARIENHIKPLIGRVRVDAVTRRDIERLRDDVTSGKSVPPKSTDKRRAGGRMTGGGGVAAQCVTLVSTMMAFAIERGLRLDNPASRIKTRPVRKMQRFLSEQEIASLATALNEAAEGSPFPVAAIRLLLLTGCRRGEIIGLQWAHVDFERAYLSLPDSKTGAKTVYLNAPALKILQELPRIKGNPFVIAGHRTERPLVGLDKIWSRIRSAAGLDDVRLHDLRHSFASAGAAGALSLPLIGALLGHKHVMTTARYAHLSADPVRAAGELIGARIEAAMRGKTDDPKQPMASGDGEVVSIASRRKRRGPDEGAL